jgi:ACS family pantothenate transporter-like MFS transporter
MQLTTYFNLWLKYEKYSVSQLNNIPTGGYAIQIVSTLAWAWTADILRLRWPSILIACGIAIIGSIILSIQPNNKSAIFAGWYLLFFECGTDPIFLVWLSDVSDSTLLRGINLVIVQTVALVINAWFPLVAYPADQAPHYSVGYYLAMKFYCVEFLTTVAITITVRVKRMRSVTVEVSVPSEDATITSIPVHVSSKNL